MVSSMLSPFTREDSCTSRFTTSAPRRLAASSNETRVRVEGSVNRLATVTPSREFAVTGAWPMGFTNFAARSSSASICALVRPSMVSKWRREPSGRVCEVMFSLSVLFKPSFQDDGGGRRIHVLARHAPAPLAAGARAAQPLLGILRGPALVDQVDGKVRALRELGGEAASGFGQGAHRAVGIIGLAHRDARRAGVDQHAIERRPVRALRAVGDRGAGMGGASQRVAAGNANAFETEIEGENDDGLRLGLVRHVRKTR